jgi:hypothetical protein
LSTTATGKCWNFIYFWSVVGAHADGILAAHYVTWHQFFYRWQLVYNNLYIVWCKQDCKGRSVELVFLFSGKTTEAW